MSVHKILTLQYKYLQGYHIVILHDSYIAQYCEIRYHNKHVMFHDIHTLKD